jgi:hypothetical protein
MVILSWKQMMTVISTMSEDELKLAINMECSTYKRKAIIKRLHSRYGQLMLKRQREQLMTGEYLL